MARERVVDPPGEGLDDRLLDLLEAVLEEQCGERRLEQRGQDVSIPRETLELVVGDVGAALREPSAEVELPRNDRAARAGDDMRADLRQTAFGEFRIALEELTRDRELEDAVSEELQPLVRRGALTRPGRVRVDQVSPLVG